MRSARLVFVSTPYASIECKDRDRNYYARQFALEAYRIVRQNGYKPISPVIAFMDVYGEFEREEVMEASFELLSVCSYYYFHPCKFSDKSRGMQEERDYARELGITELKFSLFE
ncbi:hypothetical protein [Campylobacter curvus]|uniref:DUF7768 domain-containing protein n=1 Tax=Campylobacter curvus TaxID=200 RepID=UPI0014702FF0|nr:hypothetical protein [Campylobacter curvus]